MVYKATGQLFLSTVSVETVVNITVFDRSNKERVIFFSVRIQIYNAFFYDCHYIGGIIKISKLVVISDNQ